MERLTFDGNFCDISQCRELSCPHGGSCAQRKVWEKLRAYEDSRLTPSDVHSLWGEWNAMMSVLNAIGGGYDRLRELAEADKAGRLVVLPAKTVYELAWDAGPNCDGNCRVSIGGVGSCDFCDAGELCIYEVPCKQEHIGNIGKTVFLTREEAEKALEEEKDD